jgi:amidophosphoribosyltransferase
MARDAGAKKVYFASAAPPVQFPNVYGIDMPAASELIGHNRTAEQIAELIGADWLIYQDLEDLQEAVKKKAKAKIDRFDTSVFNGDYVTGDVTPEFLKSLEDARNDKARSKEVQQGDGEVVELYNSA